MCVLKFIFSFSCITNLCIQVEFSVFWNSEEMVFSYILMYFSHIMSYIPQSTCCEVSIHVTHGCSEVFDDCCYTWKCASFSLYTSVLLMIVLRYVVRTETAQFVLSFFLCSLDGCLWLQNMSSVLRASSSVWRRGVASTTASSATATTIATTVRTKQQLNAVSSPAHSCFHSSLLLTWIYGIVFVVPSSSWSSSS